MWRVWHELLCLKIYKNIVWCYMWIFTYKGFFLEKKALEWHKSLSHDLASVRPNTVYCYWQCCNLLLPVSTNNKDYSTEIRRINIIVLENGWSTVPAFFTTGVYTSATRMLMNHFDGGWSLGKTLFCLQAPSSSYF